MNTKGKIYKGIGGFYYVYTENGDIIECRARGKFRKERIKPMIGDNVEIEVENGKGYVVEIFDRRNSLVRPAVANIDMVIVVAAAKSPDPIPFLIDKMLVNAEINGIEAVVCINKSDLADCSELRKIYESAGYKTVCVSAQTKDGMDDLLTVIEGKTAAFAGVSGVGKSTILSHIIGTELETGAVSEKISRGKHTTRHVELFKSKGDGYVLDTPGFSSVETDDIPARNLAAYFPEMAKHEGECRFRTCVHIGEPNCVVKDKVQTGEIAQSRYDSYKEMYEIQRGKQIWK